MINLNPFKKKTFSDKQDEAFADAEPVTDEELTVLLQTGETVVTHEGVKTPEEYEAENWDADRDMSKTQEVDD